MIDERTCRLTSGIESASKYLCFGDISPEEMNDALVGVPEVQSYGSLKAGEKRSVLRDTHVTSSGHPV